MDIDAIKSPFGYVVWQHGYAAMHHDPTSHDARWTLTVGESVQPLANAELKLLIASMTAALINTLMITGTGE